MNDDDYSSDPSVREFMAKKPKPEFIEEICMISFEDPRQHNMIDIHPTGPIIIDDDSSSFEGTI